MERKPPPEYVLDVFADPHSVKEIVRALLHTIFFHRLFPPLSPLTRELLDITLPAIDDVDLETLIDQRVIALLHAIESGHEISSPGMGFNDRGGRGQIAVLFFEKKRRKTYFSFKDEEVCWEQWCLDVTLASPKSEAEFSKVRRAMEKSIQKTALKIVNIMNRDKDHIPLITTTESNPFPYQIVVNPQNDNWSQRISIF